MSKFCLSGTGKSLWTKVKTEPIKSTDIDIDIDNDIDINIMYLYIIFFGIMSKWP